jgi:hypothetical protein
VQAGKPQRRERRDAEEIKKTKSRRHPTVPLKSESLAGIITGEVSLEIREGVFFPLLLFVEV